MLQQLARTVPWTLCTVLMVAALAVPHLGRAQAEASRFMGNPMASALALVGILLSICLVAALLIGSVVWRRDRKKARA